MELITKYYFNDKNELTPFKVVTDEMPTSPREFDNCSELYIQWGRDHYGDKSYLEDLETIVFNFGRRYLGDIDDDMCMADIISELERNHSDEVKVFKVWGYEHSGISFSLSNDTYPYNDRWDSGFCGFMFVTRELCDVVGSEFENAKELAEWEISEYNQWLNGEVYGYETEDDSCGGIYSDKWGEDLFNEIALDAGYGEIKFYNEDEVEVTTSYKLKSVC